MEIRGGTAIFDWWWRQIRSALPWARAGGNPPDALIIDVREFVYAPLKLTGNILLRRNGCEEFLAPLQHWQQLQPHAALLALVGLRLPASMTLHRQLRFPIKAQNHLEAAIRFEMDRLTPFSLSDVFWSVSGLTRDRQNLKMTLLIVPRLTAKPLLAALQQYHLAPSFIETAFGSIPLGAGKAGPARQARDTLLGICCSFALAIAAIPWVQQQSRMDRLNHQLKTLMPEQQALAILRQQLASLDSRHLIAAAARENGDTLEILAMLTNALPNGTWLNGLTLTANQVTLTGQSQDVPQLIAALTSSDLQNPSFIGPITRTEDGGTMFFIQASIAK